MADVKVKVAVKAYIHKQDKVLVLHKTPHEYHTGISALFDYDQPGGSVEPGEDPLEALHREVTEETGMAIEVVKPLRVWNFMGRFGQVIGIDFLCLWVEGEVALSDEHESFEWLTLEEIDHMNWTGENSFALSFQEYYKHSSPA